MAKTIQIQDETYAKLWDLKTEKARKKLAEGNYKDVNPDFDEIINDVLENQR